MSVTRPVWFTISTHTRTHALLELGGGWDEKFSPRPYEHMHKHDICIYVRTRVHL